MAKEVFPKSSKCSYNSIKIEAAVRPDDIFKNSRCFLLRNGEVVKITDNNVSVLTYKDGKFSEGEEVKCPFTRTIQNGDEIQYQQYDNLLLVAIESIGVYLFEVGNKSIRFLSILSKPYDRCFAAFLHNGLLGYYSDKPTGFHFKAIEDSGETTFIASDDLWIRDAIIRDQLLIFIGQDKIFGFELASDKGKLKKIFTQQANFSSPKIEKTPDTNYYIIFDSVSTHAISIFQFEKKLKRVATLHPDIKALFWRWINDVLYVLLNDYKNKRHFIVRYRWNNGALKLEDSIELELRDSTNSPYIHIPYAHFEECETYIVSAEGSLWVVKTEGIFK